MIDKTDQKTNFCLLNMVMSQYLEIRLEKYSPIYIFDIDLDCLSSPIADNDTS